MATSRLAAELQRAEAPERGDPCPTPRLSTKLTVTASARLIASRLRIASAVVIPLAVLRILEEIREGAAALQFSGDPRRGSRSSASATRTSI